MCVHGLPKRISSVFHLNPTQRFEFYFHVYCDRKEIPVGLFIRRCHRLHFLFRLSRRDCIGLGLSNSVVSVTTIVSDDSSAGRAEDCSW